MKPCNDSDLDSITRHSDGAESCREGDSSSLSKASSKDVDSHLHRPGGTEDVFQLGEHIEETQFGIDNHYSNLLSLVVSVFLKVRLHHIVKLTSLDLQKGSMRKKLCKQSSFRAFSSFKLSLATLCKYGLGRGVMFLCLT